MASFPTRAKRVAHATKKSRKGGRAVGPTFIQRSRAESSEQKAMFHQVLGAGRSHVKRPFFGLTDDETAKVRTALETAVEAHLRETQA